MTEEENAVLGDIKILPVEMSSRKCLNCGTEFVTHSYKEQDFCNKCFSLVCRAVFDKSNSNLTCQQLVEKLRFNTKKCSPTCDGHSFYKECKLCEQ